jgi:hypothetical protein
MGLSHCGDDSGRGQAAMRIPAVTQHGMRDGSVRSGLQQRAQKAPTTPLPGAVVQFILGGKKKPGWAGCEGGGESLPSPLGC